MKDETKCQAKTQWHFEKYLLLSRIARQSFSIHILYQNVYKLSNYRCVKNIHS